MLSPLRSFLSNRRDNPSARLPWVIETCQAERYLDDPQPWTEVERWATKDLATSSVSSPMFPWEPTTILRIRRGGTAVLLGAFDANQFVNLSPRSPASRAKPWPRIRELGLDSRSRLLPWPEAWRTSEDAREMLYTVTRNSLVSRQTAVLAAVACVRSLIDPTDRRLMQVLDAGEGWARGTVSREELRAIVDRSRTFPSQNGEVAAVNVVSLADPYSDMFPLTPFVGLSSGIDFRVGREPLGARKRVERETADLLRRTIPFREIIEGLVGLRVTS